MSGVDDMSGCHGSITGETAVAMFRKQRTDLSFSAEIRDN